MTGLNVTKSYPVFLVILFLIILFLVIDAGGPVRAKDVWRGVDLSYVNEMEDCGAVYRVNGKARDPYTIFADAGANIVRLRLWHTPDWTGYSTLADVKKSIHRARQNGMRVLLDFHYSDDWAHPGKQLVPSAWEEISDKRIMARHIYDYTLAVLGDLHQEGLVPDFVQVGNEINTQLMLHEEVAEDAPIDWSQNVWLVNAGIAAVRDFSDKTGNPVQVMLHIAQPENVERWFDAAIEAGILDFDLIGISYYFKWSRWPFARIGDAIGHFIEKYRKDVVIVETAYPWTLQANDSAANLLGSDSLIAGYPATVGGQRELLLELMRSVRKAGGLGIVYWEPAWVSTKCTTRWGQGSHWENAALFDYQNSQLHAGADFLTARP